MTLRFEPVTGSLMSVVAYSDQGRYEIVPAGSHFHIKRNGRLIHIAGYMDDAVRQAQIDNDDRARRGSGRRRA